jgi:hypothetical protein
VLTDRGKRNNAFFRGFNAKHAYDLSVAPTL